MGSEIISLLDMVKGTPTLFTSLFSFVVVVIAIYLRIKDKDIINATSITKIQNDRLVALMDQNEQLLDSVSKLQVQVSTLNNDLSNDSKEHRDQMDKMYKVTDDMRNRITELEDLVRTYQFKCVTCIYKK